MIEFHINVIGSEVVIRQLEKFEAHLREWEGKRWHVFSFEWAMTADEVRKFMNLTDDELVQLKQLEWEQGRKLTREEVFGWPTND